MDKTTPTTTPIDWEHKKSTTLTRKWNSWGCSEHHTITALEWEEILHYPGVPRAPSMCFQLRLRCLKPSPSTFTNSFPVKHPETQLRESLMLVQV